MRHKFPGQPWQAPDHHHQIPALTDDLMVSFWRYMQGLEVPRKDLPEASAIYDPEHFPQGLYFKFAGYVYIVNDELAGILRNFDIGPGGLTPYLICEADEVTPFRDQWWLVGLGAQKRSFLPAHSRRFQMIFDGKGGKTVSMFPDPK